VTQTNDNSTAHNIGIAASEAERRNFGCLHRCTLVRANKYLFGFLLLTSTLIFQLGSGSGLDIIKYPTYSNTCPLVAILVHHPKTLTEISYDTKNLKDSFSLLCVHK
jgi:hypothetical protein